MLERARGDHEPGVLQGFLAAVKLCRIDMAPDLPGDRLPAMVGDMRDISAVLAGGQDAKAPIFAL